MRINNGTPTQTQAARGAQSSGQTPVQRYRGQIDHALRRDIPPEQRSERVRQLGTDMADAANRLRNTPGQNEMRGLEDQLRRNGDLTPEQRSRAAELFVRADQNSARPPPPDIGSILGGR